MALHEGFSAGDGNETPLARQREALSSRPWAASLTAVSVLDSMLLCNQDQSRESTHPPSAREEAEFREEKSLPATQETWVRSWGREDALEKGKAMHSGILAWRIPRTEEPGGPQSRGPQGVGHD